MWIKYKIESITFKRIYMLTYDDIKTHKIQRMNRLPFFVLMAFLFAVGNLYYNYASHALPEIVTTLFQLVFLFVVFYIIIARYHDLDLSGWWALLIFIPFVGVFVMAIHLLLVKGTTGNNKYGPDPVIKK